MRVIDLDILDGGRQGLEDELKLLFRGFQYEFCALLIRRFLLLFVSRVFMWWQGLFRLIHLLFNRTFWGGIYSYQARVLRLL